MYTNNPWTKDEIELLRRNIKPENRTIVACHNKAQSLLIPFCPKSRGVFKRPSKLPKKFNPEPRKKPWTEVEMELLKYKVVPPGRTKTAAAMKAHQLGLTFNKVRKAKTPQKERVAACRDEIVAELNATGKIRTTARKFGVDYNSVRNIAVENGIKIEKRRNAKTMPTQNVAENKMTYETM